MVELTLLLLSSPLTLHCPRLRSPPTSPPCSYLVKTVALKSLELQESLPPLDELQKFNAAAQVGRWWAGT